MKAEEHLLLCEKNSKSSILFALSPVHLTSGDKFQILSLGAMHPRGWYPFLLCSKSYNDFGKEFSIRQGSKLVLQKNGKSIAVFPIRIKEDLSNGHVTGI